MQYHLAFLFTIFPPFILSMPGQVFPHVNAKSVKLSRIIAGTGDSMPNMNIFRALEERFFS